MHLRFTEEELATLVEMVSLAAEVANMAPEETQTTSDLARFESVESKVLESAKHAGMAEWIEFDSQRGKNRVTEKFQSEAYFQRCIEEFRNANFWEELMIRLAERDLIKQIGEEAYLKMDDKVRREKAEPLEKRYWAKFRKRGIAPLHWIEPNEDL